MAEREAEALPITEKQLEQYSDEVSHLMLSVQYAPKVAEPVVKKDTSGEPRWIDSDISTPARLRAQKEVKILNRVMDLSSAEPLLTEKVARTLMAIRNGLRVGKHLCDLYTQASGLQVLLDRNERRQLDPSERGEFHDKKTTAAAVLLFAAAYYVTWELSRSEIDSESRIEADSVRVLEVNLENTVDAVNCALFWYGNLLMRPDFIKSDDDIVRVTRLYFRALAEELKTRSESMKYTEPFTSRIYKLEKAEFSVNGFAVDVGAALVSVEFNRVELGEIVGNAAAKREAKLLCQRLASYCFDTKNNPFMKLGGLQALRMGWGPPGTGKSMAIAAEATLLSDYCKALNYRFAFLPLPDNIISTFQGGSADQGLSYFKQFRDPSRIMLGAIDDCEVVLEDRTRLNVSGGVREFIGVFLRMTESAYAINYGNHSISLWTNLPDIIDKAVLSRIIVRFLVAGAETEHDFIDQDYLDWMKYQKIDPKVVNMEDPAYEYLFDQKMLRSLSQAREHYMEPKDARILAVFNRVLRDANPRQHAFFGKLFAAVKKELPFFTSRDLRNIQRAVANRILDFELDEEWLAHPDKFYFLPYEEKEKIIVGRMKENMKGLKFHEVKLQETVLYMDEMMRIADATRSRRLEDLVDNIILNTEARTRFDRMVNDGKLDWLVQKKEG